MAWPWGGDRNPVARRRSDGRLEVLLPAPVRSALASMLGELDELLDAPDDPSLRRLNPPAYLQDPDHDAAYQLLAGDELRESRRTAIATAREALGRTDLSEDEAWAWIRSLNALRLVLGVRLGIEHDDHELDIDPESEAGRQAQLYEMVGEIQHWVVVALQDGR